MRLRLYMAVLNAAVLAAGLVLQAGSAFAAEPNRCTSIEQPIETDRPDTTNSSVVVPVGSLQSENGADASSQSGGHGLAGPESRLRFGIAHASKCWSICRTISA